MEEKEIAGELKLIRTELVKLSQAIALLLGRFYEFESDETEPLAIPSPLEEDEKASEEEEPQQFELKPDEDDDGPKFFCPSYVG